MFTIALHDARFFAYHGVFKEEQILGNWYIVNVEVKGNFLNASVHDDLNQTFNYGTLYEFIKEEMAQPSQLLETVIIRIKDRILGTGIVLKAIDISLKKQNPPLGGQVAASEVRYKETF